MSQIDSEAKIFTTQLQNVRIQHFPHAGTVYFNGAAAHREHQWWQQVPTPRAEESVVRKTESRLPDWPMRRQMKLRYLIPLTTILSYLLERLFFWLDVVALSGFVSSFFLGIGHVESPKFRDALPTVQHHVVSDEKQHESPAGKSDSTVLQFQGIGAGEGGSTSSSVAYQGTTGTWVVLQPATPKPGQCLLSDNVGNAVWGDCPTVATSGTTTTVTLPSSTNTLAVVPGTSTSSWNSTQTFTDKR